MTYRKRHYLYIALGVAAIGAGLTLKSEPRASAGDAAPALRALSEERRAPEAAPPGPLPEAGRSVN